MTPLNDGARCDVAASAVVGYMSPPRSYTRPESASTPSLPCTASGGGEAEDSSAASTADTDLVIVAALYVQNGGAYYGLPGVDPWDETRDARLYDGPHPVVAHPPCNRWSQLSGLVEHVHGYKKGDDGGCFAHALWAVRKFGGVLEHPAYSRAWAHYGLPKPATNGGWTETIDGELVCYFEQEALGHPARKPTWLYAAHVEPLPLPWQARRPNPDDPGWYVDVRRGQRKHGAKRMRNDVASHTPAPFRDALIAIARTSAVAPHPRQEARTNASD